MSVINRSCRVAVAAVAVLSVAITAVTAQHASAGRDRTPGNHICKPNASCSLAEAADVASHWKNLIVEGAGAVLRRVLRTKRRFHRVMRKWSGGSVCSKAAGAAAAGAGVKPGQGLLLLY